MNCSFQRKLIAQKLRLRFFFSSDTQLDVVRTSSVASFKRRKNERRFKRRDLMSCVQLGGQVNPNYL